MVVKSQYYFALLILIWVQKSVDAINFKDIHDINSIKKFIQEITDKKPSKYQFGKMLTDSEKTKILVDDLVGLLQNLNNLQDSNLNVTGDFVASLNIFDQRPPEYKNQTKLNFMDQLWRAFDNITNSINSYAEVIMNLKNDFGYNLAEYCSAVLDLTKRIALEKKGVIISMHREVGDLWWEIFQQDTNMPFSINLYSVSCGKRIVVEQLYYKFYRQMVTSYLKEYVIRYYLDVINSQCSDQNLTSIRMDKFIVISRLQKEITTMGHRHIKYDFLYRCDPLNYDDGDRKTYYELSKMIQTVIIKEEDLDIHQSCSHNCNLLPIQDSLNLTECDGYWDCQYVDSSYEICETPASDHSSRKYQWFKDSRGKVYGDNSTECKTPVKKVSSILWPSKLRWCDYCLCTCLKSKPSKEDDVLFVSFREQLTDIEKNMVVVGVRFVKKNNMIHVQIKEAELKPNGLMGKSKWKELEDFSYNKSTESFYVRNDNGTQTLLNENIDYQGPVQIELGDSIAPPGFVITGVAFQCLKNPTSEECCFRSLQTRIRVTPLDYFEGKLINDNRTQWLTQECDTIMGPQEIWLDNPDLPTKSLKNRIEWAYGHYIKFQESDLTKDAGQSTVPFFDAQDVEGELEFPLGAVGVYHRGHKGYGGFLAFKINMIDIGHIFNGELYEE